MFADLQDIWKQSVASWQASGFQACHWLRMDMNRGRKVLQGWQLVYVFGTFRYLDLDAKARDLHPWEKHALIFAFNSLLLIYSLWLPIVRNEGIEPFTPAQITKSIPPAKRRTLRRAWQTRQLHLCPGKACNLVGPPVRS